MQEIQKILEKVLNGIDLDLKDYIYLQEHIEEVQETHNIKLIEIATLKSEHTPSYKFNKII